MKKNNPKRELTYLDYRKWKAETKLAENYQKQKKYTYAIKHFENAIELYPEDLQSQIKLGGLLFNLERYDIALSYFNDILKKDKKNSEAHYNKGLTLYQLEKYKNAIFSFKKALEIIPKDSYSLHYLGHCYQELNQYKNAVECFSKELKIDSSDPHSWNELGSSYLEINKLKSALNAFTKSLFFKHNNPIAYSGIGYCYYLQKKYSNAIEFFNKSLRFDSKDIFSLHYRGHSYEELNELELALKSFLKQYELKTDFEDTSSNIGNIFYKLERYRQAKEWYIKAYSENKTSISLVKKLIKVLRKLEDKPNLKKYEKILKKLQKTKPKKLTKHKKKQKRVLERKSTKTSTSKKPMLFIIHGHDHKLRDTVKKIVQKKFTTIILQDQTTVGKTIIESFEEESKDADYAIALFTPDDKGKRKKTRRLMPRARQNVIFELGFFIAKLSRDKAFAIRKGMKQDPEFSDYDGVIDIEVDKKGKWKNKLKKKLGI